MNTTLRQQLHIAVSESEVAKSRLEAASNRYIAARDRVNELIDKLAPFDEPNGRTVTRNVVPFRNVIQLIKFVREATLDYARKVADKHDVPCMGLKEAKELVEKFVAEQHLEQQ